jgi:hypothetical protein
MALNFNLLKPVAADTGQTLMDMGDRMRQSRLDQVQMRRQVEADRIAAETNEREKSLYGRQIKKEDQEQAIKMAKAKTLAIGEEAEYVAGVPDAMKPQAFEQAKARLVQSGLYKPEELPQQYPGNEYLGAIVSRWQKTPEYQERQKTLLEMERLKSQTEKDRADAAKARRENKNPAKELSPGEKQVDETFGKEVADYYHGGGKSAVEKNLQRLQDAISTLEQDGEITGGVSTKIPLLGADAAQDVINPKMASVRDDIRNAIQGTLRQVLGGQFTEREAKAIFDRAFNPRLSDAENIRRAKAELEGLQRMAAAKDSSMNHFLASGTLKGHRPGDTRQAVAGDPQQQASGGLIPEAQAGERKSAAPKVKAGAIVEVQGKRYRVGADGDTLEAL